MPAAGAQSVPTIDTEDASLGSAKVGTGRFHPTFGIDIRNGDFARGGYDDDAANLDRLPVHVQVGFAWDLRPGSLWLVGTSSNGVHAPVAAERDSPRGWYESNNLIGLVGKVGGGATIGAAYAIKTSPNGISATTHEASLTATLDGDHGLAALHPSAAATIRAKGDGGLYTQIGIAPEIALYDGDDGPTLSFPAIAGVGWGGFYDPGSGSAAYGSAGLAYSHPFTAGGAHWRLRVEGLAVVRDRTLRRLGSLDAETGVVVPLVTIGLSLAY
ncbi:hypothetical protein M9979_00845 [Sphingomonas sp. RP10(2022)]|uniref:Uncharacterized protein n=1 Tax=Sphingomonas liriopis TaxID=2949094 RepID=A0A9X2HPL1_9SPHN|nr:hypothetical protein [Sphingomonas liriopis]MCP3733432.1 hypothetical protein [Sphingomonas liriopis]